MKKDIPAYIWNLRQRRMSARQIVCRLKQEGRSMTLQQVYEALDQHRKKNKIRASRLSKNVKYTKEVVDLIQKNIHMRNRDICNLVYKEFGITMDSAKMSQVISYHQLRNITAQ